MHKVHLTALYLGLALAITALVVVSLAYTGQQAQIAGLVEREQATGEWLNSLTDRVEGMDAILQGTQQSIAALDERSAEATDWQNETAAWAHAIAEWQTDVASFMDRTRQQGVPAEWQTWRGSVDRSIANVQGDVTAIRSGVTRNQSDISSLYNWSDDITAYLNSGQQQGASAALGALGALGELEAWATSVDRRITNLEEQSARVVDYLNSGQQQSAPDTSSVILDLIRASNGDILAAGRLLQYLASAGG